MANFDFQQTAQDLQDFVNRTPAEIAELRALYEALTQTGVTPVAADDWPVSDPQQNVIYRVAGTSSYTDYMWNGTDFIPMATYTNTPTDIPIVGSTDVITAGGVANHGSAFDISEYNKIGSTLTTYADLSAALGTDGANVPSAVRKGGMSVKFVQSNDNNYIRYNLLATSFTTDTTQWAIAEEGVYVENPEFVDVKADKDGKILWAIRTDGDFFFGTGIPQQIVDYVIEKINEVKEGTDSTDIDGVNKIVVFLSDFSTSETLKSLLDEKVDKVNGKGLSTNDYTNSDKEIVNTNELVGECEYAQVVIDENERILEGITAEGRKEIHIPIEMPLQSIESTSNPELIEVKIDKDEKVIEGVAKDGSKVVSSLKANYLELLNETSTFGPNFKNAFQSIIDGDDISGNIMFPKKMYILNPVKNVYGVMQRLYVEGIVKSLNLSNIKINGHNNSIVYKTDNFIVSADTYKPKAYNLQVVSSNISNALGKYLRIMCIGDSLTDQGYPVVCKAFFDHYEDKLGGDSHISSLFIGTRVDSGTIKIGDDTYSNVRACNEGRGGVPISDYLRHAFLVGLTNAKVSWDSLGLATKTRNGVPGRAVRKDLPEHPGHEEGEEIRTTCHGYYDADPSEELWNWMKNSRHVTSFTYDGTTYTLGNTYSQADDAAQIAYIKYICENPDYPFFDYNTVQSSNGAYAFNLKTYLDRYKTIDPTTGERLTNDTKGSKVVNVTSYDVCEPTHIVIISVTNDSKNFAYGADIADDAAIMASLIQQYNTTYETNIKVAVAGTRQYGVIDLAGYANIGGFNKFGTDATGFVRCGDANERFIEISESNTDFDFLPLYAIQSPRSGVYDYIDPLTLESKQMCSSDTTHAGDGSMNNVMQYLDRAYLVNSWVISTL